jgi:hypothetical protein
VASGRAVTQNQSSSTRPNENKRILGIIPNYRTSPTLENYEPLTSREKFRIASQDAFDRGTVLLAALFAGQAQLTNANRPFRQGAAGFGKYFGASYGDFLIGDYMTEGIFPTLLHQDPRYFRRGAGSGWSRLRYAFGQIFWTHRDSGGTKLKSRIGFSVFNQFNPRDVQGDVDSIHYGALFNGVGRTFRG